MQSDKLNYEIHSLRKAVFKSDKKSATWQERVREKDRERETEEAREERGVRPCKLPKDFVRCRFFY